MLVRLSWPKDVPLPAFQRPAGATVESTSHNSVTFLTSDTAGVISKPNGFDVQAPTDHPCPARTRTQP